MNRILKTCSTFSLVALCAIGLVSCGLGSTEKNAKTWMKENPTGFEAFDYSGNGLVYETKTCKFDFASHKGTYEGTTKFKFSAEYNWEDEELTFKVTKITDGSEGIAHNVDVAACKVEVTAAYAAVAIAANLYESSQA